MTKSSSVQANASVRDHIARVVATEVDHRLAKTNPAEYEKQIQGVVNTLLNRTVSDQFSPDTVEGIANAKNQFSKINGPKTYTDKNGVKHNLNPYGSVENAPQAPAALQRIVDSYVGDLMAKNPQAFAAGATDYLNPTASSQSAMDAWGQGVVDQGYGAGTNKYNTQYYGNAAGVSPISADVAGQAKDYQDVSRAQVGIGLGMKGPLAADSIDRADARGLSTYGRVNGDYGPLQAAIDQAGPRPQTFGDRMRATLGLPATLGIQAVNGMISLGDLAAAAAANVAQQSAAAQNPQAAPPSSFPSRPAGPVSSNQFSAKTPGPVAQGPDLSSPLGRMNAAIGRNPNAGVASATPTNDYRDTPQDRMRAAVGAPPAASYQGPGQRGFSPPAASSYDTLGMTAGPTGFSTGGMFSAGPQAMGAAMGSFAKAAPKASPQAYGGPTAAADASNRPQATTMPMGFNPPSTVGMDIGTQLTDPTTSFTHVSPQAAMDEANLSAQIANALSTGYAPGAVSNKKPGEPGYQAPAPSVPKLTPKMQAKPAAPAPVAARPLAPPQSQFAPQTPVYNNIGSIVGAIGQAGKAYTPDFAPNTSVYNQNGQVVGSISGRTTQASPLSSGGLASLGGLFNNGSAALGSLGGFASAIGGYNSGTSNAYGNQNYGTRSYGGNGGSTLGGGDNHRAL